MSIKELLSLDYQLQRLEAEGKNMSALREEVQRRIFEEIENYPLPHEIAQGVRRPYPHGRVGGRGWRTRR